MIEKRNDGKRLFLVVSSYMVSFSVSSSAKLAKVSLIAETSVGHLLR